MLSVSRAIGPFTVYHAASHSTASFARTALLSRPVSTVSAIRKGLRRGTRGPLAQRPRDEGPARTSARQDGIGAGRERDRDVGRPPPQFPPSRGRTSRPGREPERRSGSFPPRPPRDREYARAGSRPSAFGRADIPSASKRRHQGYLNGQEQVGSFDRPAASRPLHRSVDDWTPFKPVKGESMEYNNRGSRGSAEPRYESRRYEDRNDVAEHSSGNSRDSFDNRRGSASFEGRRDRPGSSYRGSSNTDERRPRSEGFEARRDATEHSFRGSRDLAERRPGSRRYEGDRGAIENNLRDSRKPADDRYGSGRYESRRDATDDKFYGDRNTPDKRPSSGRFEGRREVANDDYQDWRKFDSKTKPPRPAKAPPTIPYTTPASEFLYGTSSVTAALKAHGRKLYNFYIYQGENRTARSEDESIMKLSLARGVKINKLDSPDWLSVMDRMATGRPHNGYVLETSPLAKRPITSLGVVAMDKGSFELDLDHQTREEEVVNGIDTTIQYTSQKRRHPLVLMLDGILDTGNIGAIMRSAYFLGADAVVVSTHSAPLGAVALKASAGAIENLPIMSVRQTGAFVKESQKNGWKFYAAVAPPSHLKNASAAEQAAHKHFSTSSLAAPLIEHPCVLMLGNEGTGLKRDLQRQADYSLSVEGKRSGMGGVDSLNVSVAAALLCDAFVNGSKSSAAIPADKLF